MNIVILDGFTLISEKISWEPINQHGAHGSVQYYDRTPPELVVERAQNADILLVNKVVLTQEIIQQLPNLKYIGALATGYDQIDIHAAARLHIPVTNTPQYGVDTVAQHVFALILEIYKQVALHDASIRNGEWNTAPDFCYWKQPIIDLSGKTIGIIGFGGIGQKVATIAQAFDMQCLIHTRSPQQHLISPQLAFASLDGIFKKSDIITLHCPLTPETKEIINKDNLALMKKKAIIINTARGGLVNEADLAHALITEQIAGAGLDVLAKEPPEKNNPLLAAPHCFFTPHIAWASEKARQNLINIAGENIKAFLDNNPINVVNKKFL